jgi:MOSC domain-containing protein YiiM
MDSSSAPSTVRLLSVNIGALERLAAGSRTRTGIGKYPVGGSVLCDVQGLVGDAIGNRTHHGGADQAVYLYSHADYAWWSEQLGRECPPGLFGENLTIDCWWEAPRVGDRLRLGDVVLELTAPRIPCSTLAARMEDAQFVHQFRQAVRPGAYARVLQGGAIEAGMSGQVERGDDGWATITSLFDLWYQQPRDRGACMEALRSPLAIRLRERVLGWVAGG